MEHQRAAFTTILASFVLFSLLFAGCASQPPAQAPPASQPACGNGVKEAGETSDNCCKDAGCPATFRCIPSGANSSAYSCVKLKKEDTPESGAIKTLSEDIGARLKSQENLGEARADLDKITNYTSQLRAKGYDTATEELLLQATKARIDGYVLVLQHESEFTSSGTDGQRLAVLNNESGEVANTVSTLMTLKGKYAANLDEAQQVYGYNMSNYIESWTGILKDVKISIKQLENTTAPG